MPPKESSIALSLLNRAHSPESAARIHLEKVIQRPLHLKPTEPTPPTAQEARRAERARKLSQRRKKLKPAPLSSRQKRALCLYEIPKAAQKYEVYKELNHMWAGYIHEILGYGESRGGNPDARRTVGQGELAKLCAADFHGAEIEVVRSRCVGRVGVKGIVVKDSKHIFEVVTKTDKVKVLPKEGTIFKFMVPLVLKKEKDIVEHKTPESKAEKEAEGSQAQVQEKQLVFELHGDQFMVRAADRANRKFKQHFLPDL